MNQEKATDQLQRELREYMSLTDEAQKQAFWQRIRQEASGRTEDEKSLFRQAIAQDINQLRTRVFHVVDEVNELSVATKQ